MNKQENPANVAQKHTLSTQIRKANHEDNDLSPLEKTLTAQVAQPCLLALGYLRVTTIS